MSRRSAPGSRLRSAPSSFISLRLKNVGAKQTNTTAAFWAGLIYAENGTKLTPLDAHGSAALAMRSSQGRGGPVGAGSSDT
jgi:hypothetical protein